MIDGFQVCKINSFVFFFSSKFSKWSTTRPSPQMAYVYYFKNSDAWILYGDPSTQNSAKNFLVQQYNLNQEKSETIGKQ